MQIKPLFDRVLLKSIEEESKTQIYVPKDSRDKSLVMEIVATGNEVKSIKKGDKAIIAKYAGTKIDEYWIIRECEILGVAQ